MLAQPRHVFIKLGPARGACEGAAASQVGMARWAQRWAPDTSVWALGVNPLQSLTSQQALLYMRDQPDESANLLCTRDQPLAYLTWPT